ncbi:unnamed protein product, partial [Polarella glacialis]
GADLLSVQQLPKKISQLLRLAKQSQEEPPANDPLKKVGNQLALLEQRVTNVHAGMDNVAIFHAHLERVSQEVADLANHQSTEDSLFGLLEGCNQNDSRMSQGKSSSNGSKSDAGSGSSDPLRKAATAIFFGRPR